MEKVEEIPILVGSTALQILGYHANNNPRDIDLICSLQKAQELLWNADAKLEDGLFAFSQISSTTKTKQKKKSLLVFENKEKTKRKKIRSSRPGKRDEESRSSQSVSDNSFSFDKDHGDVKIVDAHIIDSCSWGMREIFNKCQSLIWHVTYHDLKLSPTYTIKVGIPPIEWIYALYRGHVHRIPQVFSKQVSNIVLWKKYMSTIEHIRNKYGYKKLDELLKSEQDNNARQIFEKEFDYVTDKLGDAPSLENKEEESFFDDNVKRYIDHDILHNAVAIMNRGKDATPLFPKFIVDAKKSVMMDEGLFFAAPFEEQFQTLREEIMVLYLERKALPAAIEFGDTLESLWEFDEIVCHFITNLCGNGHSWLRNFALNHYSLLMDESNYPNRKIYSFVENFRKDGPITSDEQIRNQLPPTIETLDDFIKLQQVVKNSDMFSGGDINDELLSIIEEKECKLGNELEYKWSNPLESDKDIDDDIEDEKILGKLWGHSAEIVDGELYLEEASYSVDEDFWNRNINLCAFFDKYFGSNRNLSTDVVLYDGSGCLVFNVKEGVAFHHCKGGSTLILFLVEISGATFCVHPLYVSFDNNRISFDQNANQMITYSEDTKTSYYYKSTCDGGYEKKRETIYLAHYGTMFEELEGITEILGRLQNGLFEDEDSDRSSY